MTVDAASRKAELRSLAVQRRGAVPDQQRHQAADSVMRELDTYIRAAGVRTVLAYAAFGTELSLDPLLADLMDRGVGVFLPYVVGHDLQITRVRSLADDLIPGWRGVREPHTRTKPARVDRIELFIVPGLAFDAEGGRTGYGGGHFDRLLCHASPAALKIGVALSAQLVARTPVEDHDQRMSYVLTEQGWLPKRPATP